MGYLKAFGNSAMRYSPVTVIIKTAIRPESILNPVRFGSHV